jgi:hypothetical protein
MASTTKRLTISELLERYPSDVMGLSPQQRLFVLEYIAGGLASGKYDAKAAALKAYPHVEKIGIWANRLLVNARVKRVIRLHQGLTEAEVLLAEAKVILNRARRSGVNPSLLVAPLLELAAALRAYVAKEKS